MKTPENPGMAAVCGPSGRRLSLIGHPMGALAAMLAAGVLPLIGGWGICAFLGIPLPLMSIELVLVAAMLCSMAAVAYKLSLRQAQMDHQRLAAEADLFRLAVSDQLTGLLNRRGLQARLDAQWARFRMTGQSSAIVVMDLDHFKRINDTLGHAAGDDVLCRVSAALQPLVRKGDAFGRWGGEEFLFVLDQAETTDLAALTERFRQAVRGVTAAVERLAVPDGPVISASFGISIMQAGDAGCQAAVERADAALYTAKAEGRNCVRFDPVLRLAA